MNPADKIERRLVKDLIPYARNSRTHSDSQVAQIAASIKEWGWTMPILIDEAGGIIAGHGRVLAARSLGHKDLPVVVASGWSETKKRAYVIADNKLALNAGWDNEMLSLEIQELQDVGFDLDLLGFDPSEMNAASVDYSVLDGEDVKDQLSDMAKGVRKAIQIEFEPEHYDEAFELVKFWRDQKGYVGMMLMNHLKNEKSKL